ncbi:MAG: RNA methyltransferase [Candidatus Njordarchaeales archaeon]
MVKLFFVLVRPKYPINIGFTARVIKNFGFRNLILIAPRCELDDIARRFAAHAQDLLDSAEVFSSISEFIEAKGIHFIIGTTARVGGDKNPRRTALLSTMLREYIFPEGSRIAVLFGSEDTGLSNKELNMCDVVVTIPTSEEYPVMNLSHAVAIIAYELAIMLRTMRKLPYRPSSPHEREILISYMERLIEEVMGDAPEGKVEIYKGIVKNFISRAFLTGREVHSLIGFFRRILAKIQYLRDKKYGD